MTEQELIKYWALKVDYFFNDNQLFENVSIQNEFEKSKVRNKDGTLKIVYRGDGSDLNGRYQSRSDTEDTGIWFTSKEEIAASYGNIEKCVLNIERPFVFDAEGSYWNDIEFDKIKTGKWIKIPRMRYKWEYYEDFESKSKIQCHIDVWDKIDVDDIKTKEIKQIDSVFIDANTVRNLPVNLRKLFINGDEYQHKDEIIRIFKKIPNDLKRAGKDDISWKFDPDNVKGDRISVNDLVRYVKHRGNYDGVIIKNILDGGSSIDDIKDLYDLRGSVNDGDFYKQTEYIIFDQRQMKTVNS